MPYLYIATADTRNGQDRFDDFVAMKFSDRTEVVLGAKVVRHHDLSDIGRAITKPMRIRGDAQTVVERTYAGVQEMVVRFSAEHSSTRTPGASLSDWLEEHKVPDDITVTVRPGIEPAPTITAVLQTLSDRTVADLKDARQRDPEAALFHESSLSQLVTAASARQPRVVGGLADFAVSVHPTSAVLLAQASDVALGTGDRAKAIERARSCAAIDVDSDWQASIAVGNARLCCGDCGHRIARSGSQRTSDSLRTRSPSAS